MDQTLQRITTEYQPFEDRIKLAGLIADNQPVVMWLTQRLLRRLLPAMLGWLERQAPAATPRPEVLQTFAQEVARAAQVPAAAVPVVSGAAEWLVRQLDVTMSDQGIVLVFQQGADGELERIVLPMHATLLRQWLGILHDAFVEAEWPLDLWPAWLREAAVPAAGPAAVLH